MPKHAPSEREEPSAGEMWSSGPVRVVTSETLLAGARELAIRHGDAEYRLRLTRAGKLILTKATEAAAPRPAAP